MPTRPVALVLAAFALAACASAPDEGEEEKFLTPAGTARKALPVSTDPSTQVWAVTAAWSDTATPAARAAGLAWPADSGLRWDEKFAR